MPTYEFVCGKCNLEDEKFYHSMLGEHEPPQCPVCHLDMIRAYRTPTNIIMPQTGREKILGTLNQEEGAQTFPGGDKYRDRYEKAMAKGLEPEHSKFGINS